ncbi:MAG: hypothetical protein U9Q77_02720 [Candidatus Marinimicrobia bacterium]|nr:hypothetical protein [Candidatus Neomarinimicrobiota bacterium]
MSIDTLLNLVAIEMHLKRSVLAGLLLSVLVTGAYAQGVYARGSFTSIPAGKHVNHSYYGTWNAYFAVEDGVLVYDHHNEKWLDPITASDGLLQYPVLLVWQDHGTQDVWIVTPDYVFVYDHLTGWMTNSALPRDEKFSGVYELGTNDRKVIVTARPQDAVGSYSAIFLKSSGIFENWGPDSTLDIQWNEVHKIGSVDPDLRIIYESLPLQTVINGGFDASGMLHLDGFPQRSAVTVSALSGAKGAGEAFLSTYGMGIFHQRIPGGGFRPLPFGLLSPDVMCMQLDAGQLILGGRAGLTYLDDFHVEYDEAIRDPVFDYSFISAIDKLNSDLIIAGRGGVFKKTDGQNDWERLITKKDLISDRIYSVAVGMDGNLMVATERNAYLYHDSGLILQTLFPTDLDWPVFDINYAAGKYYLSTYYGLFIFDETNLSITGKINSHGDFLSLGVHAAIDPIYESVIQGETLWASTHRGLITMNMLEQNGSAFLAPHAQFKPRGITLAGRRVWIGTDLGLFSFEPNAAVWRHYTRNDGLISNLVTDLAADGNYIWVGTNLGLTRIMWQNLY